MKIIQIDVQFAFIPLECNDENAVLCLCVGVFVGEQLTTMFLRKSKVPTPDVSSFDTSVFERQGTEYRQQLCSL